MSSFGEALVGAFNATYGTIKRGQLMGAQAQAYWDEIEGNRAHRAEVAASQARNLNRTGQQPQITSGDIPVEGKPAASNAERAPVDPNAGLPQQPGVGGAGGAAVGGGGAGGTPSGAVVSRAPARGTGAPGAAVPPPPPPAPPVPSPPTSPNAMPGAADRYAGPAQPGSLPSGRVPEPDPVQGRAPWEPRSALGEAADRAQRAATGWDAHDPTPEVMGGETYRERWLRRAEAAGGQRHGGEPLHPGSRSTAGTLWERYGPRGAPQGARPTRAETRNGRRVIVDARTGEVIE